MDGLQMKYFVLKPAGDDAYAHASRVAMRAYAHQIGDVNPQLSADLFAWTDKEAPNARLAELVDTPVLETGAERREGSNPSPSTKFVEKSFVATAVQWFKHGDHPAVLPYSKTTIDRYPAYETFGILDGAGYVRVTPGDWVVTDCHGTHRVYRSDVFSACYVAVSEGNHHV